jgi:hypothetical protein
VCDVADGTCIHLATCDDFNDCTTEMCDPADESCSTPSPVADGTQCEGGTCRAGACELAGTVLPCTEQGIRNAIAAGDGTYLFACDGTTPVVTQAEIEIDNDVILDGEGKLTVDGNCEHRVFSVPETVTAELRDFVITGGATPGEGGGIRNLGTLTVTNTTVYGNTGDYNGGGIESDGTLTLTNSTVSGNRGGSGGGIYVGHSGILTVTNSTLSGNTTDSCGGGIDVDGAVALVNSTVSGNTSNGCADELFNQGFLVLVGSIVSGDADQNCSGVTSLGYNIESPLDTCGFDQATDHVNLSAEALALGPLQDNGGPTETHALGAGSVAIDQIPEADCEVDTDQRGEPRPGDSMCDVGAFEVQGPIKSGLWLGGSPASNTDGNPFDTGWAICFYVNEDGTALTPSTDCDIDGNDDEAYMLEVSWKNDVGAGTVQGEVGVCNGNPEQDNESIGIGDSSVLIGTLDGLDYVPIENNSFVIEFVAPGITYGEIQGTFNGDTASGTATWTWSPGMGFSQCELDGGWTATPAETDCTVVDDFTECRSDGMVGFCRQDLCVTMECSGLEDGTICENAVLGDGWLGVCEAGQCTKPEDCTGLPDGLICTGGDGGFCEGGECVPLP